MKHRVLAVAPHHDDECLGCGGFLVKLKRYGWDPHIVVVFAPLEGAESPMGRQRIDEAASAASVLGASRLGDLCMPCRSDVGESDLVWKLVRAIRIVRPDMLLIPHSGERDPEHRLTHRACMEALWLSESSFRRELGAPVSSISLVLGYEVWTPSRRPQLTIDISAQIASKLDALQCYRSQLQTTPLTEATRGLAMYRGAMFGGGCTWAESYTVERMRETALSILTSVGFDEADSLE